MMRNGQSGDKVELLGDTTFNHRIDPAVELPNQIPVTSEIPKSSAICNATVKWKSRLSTSQAPDRNLLDAPSSPTKQAGVSDQLETREKNPEVVITAVGSQSNVGSGLMKKDTKSADVDNLSQNSVWTRHSRNGSIQGSGSRPSSRNSLTSGRVASAFIAMGTGASFTELPKGGVVNDGQAQMSRVNTVDNPLLAAIPYLPVKLAWIFLLFNILVPGLGTMLAGISMLCCGTRQQNNKQDDDIGLCCTNIFVGVSQLFTVTFLLIGWIWSITWGVYMVVFAKEHKRLVDQERRLRRVTTAAKAFKAGRSIHGSY